MQARDLPPEEQAVCAVPDVVTVHLHQEAAAANKPFHYLLLCTDGLTNAVSNEAVSRGAWGSGRGVHAMMSVWWQVQHCSPMRVLDGLLCRTGAHMPFTGARAGDLPPDSWSAM